VASFIFPSAKHLLPFIVWYKDGTFISLSNLAILEALLSDYQCLATVIPPPYLLT